MSKKILILTGSPREGGNSDLLAEAFVKGAEAAGHEIKVFPAGRSTIGGCRACEACFSTGAACTFDDDFNKLAPLLTWADALLIATPLYYFSFPSQLKAAIDKFYAFSVSETPLSIRESFLIACGETDVEADFEGLLASYRLIASYLEWEDKGFLPVLNVATKGDVKNTGALEEAEKIGREF